MRWRGSIFDGLSADDGFKASMKALADRGRALARGYVRRPERRVRMRAAPASPNAYARPVNVKLLYHDRARGAFPNSVAVLANYLAKDGPLFDRDRLGIDKGRSQHPGRTTAASSTSSSAPTTATASTTWWPTAARS
ncbi:hypothetical protein [Azospirillum argentinense]|uniref:hypothetical protein n=1 Tax=Azospirillum argentinense TaxID=2970906 RepID=UPI001FFF3065|nr:hypothetical protein [Azospirillum argentinense]